MRVIVKDRICRQCSKSFPGGPHAWYCPECREERRREAAARRRARHGIAERPLGSIDHCDICGGEYIVINGMQKHCPGCAPEAIREAARIAARKWQREHRNPARRSFGNRQRSISTRAFKLGRCQIF